MTHLLDPFFTAVTCGVVIEINTRIGVRPVIR